MDYYNQILQKSPVYEKLLPVIEKESSQSLCHYQTVLAPVLLEYVKWVLLEAEKSGKKRLYFLARDGYQMYLAARQLCSAWKLELDCRYLKVSRYSMRVPEYALLKEKCLDRICVGGIDVTFAKIMKRAALTELEGLELAALTGYGGKYHRSMSYREVMGLKEKLRHQERFFDYVYEHSREAYPNAVGYLKQEGLLDEVSYGLVDSGWVGTLQQSIQNLVRHAGGTKGIEGYYFGLYEIPKDSPENTYHGFYFEPRSGMRRKAHFSNCLFEAVFSAPEGMTLRYEKDCGNYMPVLDQRRCQNAGMAERAAALEAYVKEYLAHEKEMPPAAKRETVSRESSAMVEAMLSKLMGKPTLWEANTYGSSLFSDDVLEDDMKKVSQDLTEEELNGQHLPQKLLRMTGLVKWDLRESAWIEGSIVQNGLHVKKHLRHAVLYKYFIYFRKLM